MKKKKGPILGIQDEIYGKTTMLDSLFANSNRFSKEGIFAKSNRINLLEGMVLGLIIIHIISFFITGFLFSRMNRDNIDSLCEESKNFILEQHSTVHAPVTVDSICTIKTIRKYIAKDITKVIYKASSGKFYLGKNKGQTYIYECHIEKEDLIRDIICNNIRIN